MSVLLSLLLAATSSQPMLHDSRGRPVIEVHLNERHTIPMVVDTAAQSSLISASAAEKIGLAPSGDTVMVSGATGSEASARYQVEHLVVGAVEVRDTSLVALPNTGSTEASGIVGMDILAGRKLVFDRGRSQFAVMPSGEPQAGFVAVEGELTQDGFVQVPVGVSTLVIDATVDTGAAITLANMAALDALGLEEDDPRLVSRGTIQGASSVGRRVVSAEIPEMSIGPVKLSDVDVYFSDDDSDVPTLLLGSDLLNKLSGYAVDLGRAELHVDTAGR